MTKPITRKLRCAVYTRKSSEEGLEQEFNSLHAQREACEAYIASQRSEGWALIREPYDDGGFSGGTLERPGLKRLLTDVEEGLIDVVVVYKIDRLSRSLMDFSKLVEVFDRVGVTFVSVTQSFNTTTSMGRLFPLVPERARKWTPEQHETDRCSRSLAAYALCGICGIEDAAAVGALVDGGDDGGIDALYFDRAGQRLLVVQSKFKRPNNPDNPQGTGPNQGETLKFINGTKALMERRFEGFNAAVRNRLDEVEEALDTPGVKICLLLPFLGEALDVHARADVDAFVAQCNNLSDSMTGTVVGITQTYDWMVAEQANNAVSVRLTLEKWSSVTAPRKAVYGLVKGQDLAALVTEHGTALFERNIRHYLGSVGVNVAIEETVRRRPEDFFYLNNGITAVATAITPAPGSPDRCVFGLTAFSIVNGAQTAGSITTASIAAAISDNAKLHITIIEVPDPADDFAVRVTRARNYQNQVRGVDFAALDPNQERIRQELAAAGIRYHYRASAESRVRQDDAFTLEEAALALACLAFAVTDGQRRGPRGQTAIDLVVVAKREASTRPWPRRRLCISPAISCRSSAVT